MTDIVLIDPADVVIVTADWTADLADGIALVSVTHTLPAPLVLVDQSLNPPANQSQVKFSGAVHGMMYQIKCAAVLNDGETLNKTVAVRCLAS